MKICAIIPARGGSKGIPRKNLRLLGGVPLVAHAIAAARGCCYIDACLLTTEDPEIRAAGVRYGAEIIDRPAELAGDLETSAAVVRHALAWLESAHRLPEYIVLLQPTSPLRTAAHLTECIEKFFESGARSAISVTEPAESPFKAMVEEAGELRPLFNCGMLEAPRQTLPGTWAQNGAIYLLGSRTFLDSGRFFVPPVMPFIMDPESSIDIDTLFDLKVAEAIYAAAPDRSVHA